MYCRVVERCIHSLLETLVCYKRDYGHAPWWCNRENAPRVVFLVHNFISCTRTFVCLVFNITKYVYINSDAWNVQHQKKWATSGIPNAYTNQRGTSQLMRYESILRIYKRYYVSCNGIVIYFGNEWKSTYIFFASHKMNITMLGYHACDNFSLAFYVRTAQLSLTKYIGNKVLNEKKCK